jgi:multidrug efflux system membrane fusion protein
VIDPRPYQAQLDQAVANRDRDQAHLENAKIDLNRYTDLAKQKSIAQQLADSQKAIVDQLVATIKSDEAIIESARVNLGYTNLTSPIDGVTGIRQIDIGNVIHPTDVNGLLSRPPVRSGCEPNFPTRSICCGQASSSTHACSSTRGMTA